MERGIKLVKERIQTNIHYKALLNFAKEIFTIEDIPYRWSTQDCMTVDGLPYVGQFIYDTPNLYLATGFQKWGMTNSMASSMILRDLIVDGESPWGDVYNPSRKTVTASTKEFVVQNTNLAGQLLDGKLSKLPKDIVVKSGEGKVLEIDGERVGAYRDEDGELHLVNTTCTHMGCELNWNSAEISWDCPCHGSRFTYTGEIIQGPAVKPLSFDRDVNTIKKLINEDF
ncbi:MAG TPA: FAD-dependent oxidoreductase [Tissierellaceae bacterium]|nr:FAD-dependent oxidoreductase [Tissierellaceae bacterium]